MPIMECFAERTRLTLRRSRATKALVCRFDAIVGRRTMQLGRVLLTIQARFVAVVFLVLSGFEICAAHFGKSDTNFLPPRFTATVHPGYVRADGRGGLLWTFVNGFNLDGADGRRLGGMIRTTEAGVVDPGFVIGPALRSCLGTAVQADGKILVGATQVGDTASNGAPNWRVFRVLTNGVLDTRSE